MKALTLKQPWAWAVAHAGKDVENRTWKPHNYLIGQRIAIHSGMSFDDDEMNEVICLSGAAPKNYLPPEAYAGGEMTIRGLLRPGAIVALATVAGWVTGCMYETRMFAGNYLGAAPMAVRKARHSKWFTGPYGWLLTDVITLPELISCKGQQGLWDVPPEVEAEINRQIRGMDILNRACCAALEATHERDE